MDPTRIDELLIRSLQGQINEEEAEILRRWRMGAPKNEEYYRTFAGVWRMTVNYRGPIRGTPPEPAQVIRAGREEWRGSSPPLRPGWAISTAAVIAALFVGSYIAQLAIESSAPVSQSTEITTGPGEMTTVTLWDGTAVRLGPDSELRVIAQGDDLVAWLEGRAFFGVLPGSPHTFTVNTRHGAAMALGTRFEVHTEERELKVLVVQGSVRVSSGGASIELEEGLMTRSIDGEPPWPSRVENIHALLDWMGFTLVFRETPLRRVISEIAHRYGTSIELVDPAMGDLPVTATFAEQPVEGVVFVVCEIVGAVCTVDEGRFRVGDRPLGSPISN